MGIEWIVGIALTIIASLVTYIHRQVIVKLEEIHIDVKDVIPRTARLEVDVKHIERRLDKLEDEK